MSHPAEATAIAYQQEAALSVAEFRDVLARSGLAERRPAEDADRLAAMLRHGNLVVTARNAQGLLVGVARSVTDFAFCCYLSDLAVDRAYQHRGIGRELIRRTREALHPQALLLLLAAPAARDYYGHIGFQPVENAWRLDSGTPLR